MVDYLGEAYRIYIPESGLILILRKVKTIGQPSQLEEVLVGREATEELDQVNDLQEMDSPLAAPAEELAPADPDEIDPDLALEHQSPQDDLMYLPNLQW